MNAPNMMPEDLNHDELLSYAHALQEIIKRSTKLENDLAAHLNRMVEINSATVAQLWSLVDAYDADDTAAITLQLRQMSEQRKVCKGVVQ
jgi:ABC-type transporter Mla MlaB component